MATQDQTHMLQTSDQLKLLDEIDKLRSQGISHYVSLPQLIVCGDQSSGKSSVLEAISGITFPTKDNLCTRFATEVILRKASAISISVHIIPSKTRTPEEEARLKDFGETLQDLERFAPLVDKAKDVMGISDTTGAFSNDVLRVEISGPDRPHLTIVDLPGLIHSENKLQSAADVTLVWDMVRGYMENRRSIVLAVISAQNDYANQAVLKLAKEIDKSGSRTLGVITKPDTLPVGSESEAGFVSLSHNEDIVFRLGWHVVRNRKYEERNQNSEARNAAEAAFFSQGVWKDLPRSMVGNISLRTRLSKVLLDQIKAELPALVEDIESNLADCEAKLAKLGSKRTTLGEQRLFLLHIGQAFQAIARAAIDGAYDDAFFGDSRSSLGYPKRLRAVIQNLNLSFANKMRKRGHQRRIVEAYTDQDLSNSYNRKEITRADYEAEILELLRSSRGRELPGMFNPMIVSEIFHQQAKPWDGIVRDHVHLAWKAVGTFLGLAVADLTDENTLNGLLHEVIHPLMQEHLAKVNGKLEELLLPHIHGHPITYNHYFTETIQNIRQERQKKEITANNKEKTGTFKMSEIVSALTSRNEADMDKYACSEILLCMEAYYKVAMKVLVDNVAVQAIEACLITHLPDIISPASVVQMDDGTITRIAAEPDDHQSLREQLTRKLAVLKAGLEICTRYSGRRNTTGVATGTSILSAQMPWRGVKASSAASSPSLSEPEESSDSHESLPPSPSSAQSGRFLLRIPSPPLPPVAKLTKRVFETPAAEKLNEEAPLAIRSLGFISKGDKASKKGKVSGKKKIKGQKSHDEEPTPASDSQEYM